MKKFILGFLLLISFYGAFSQKIFFIYLQSEPEQPFYLKMNEKLHSSTASGYLILSRLRDSTYSFTIGFPQNKWTEQKFSLELKAKDHGYLLKNFGEKGWGLFDLQTMTIQMALPSSNSGSIKTEPKEVSQFTAILSRAADDPSLKERPVATVVKMEEKPPAVETAVLKEEIKPVAEPPVVKLDQAAPGLKKDESIVVKENKSENKELQQPVEKKDTPTVIMKEVSTETTKLEQPAPKTEAPINIPASEYQRSVITKKSESSTSEGFGLTFLDEYDGKKDTIRIIIPNTKKILAEIREPAQDEKKFLDLGGGDPIKQTEPVINTSSKEKVTEKAIEKRELNPICNVASESDFLKLRKKMAAQKTDDGMTGEAKRMFKSRCFTVTQLKNLSALYLNDNGRYNFFDAAYDHVFDQNNFSSLSSELKDEYFINRFKAMIRQPA